MEIFQEDSAMEASKRRMNRDVRALQWLIDNMNEINEVQTFVLAFIDSFDEKWGRNVWRAVIGDLGFTIEPFFLALRQLLPTSSSPDTLPSSELTKEFYPRTFKVINLTGQRARIRPGRSEFCSTSSVIL